MEIEDGRATESIWIKLAKGGAAGDFDTNKVFIGLCKAMLDKIDREKGGKGMQNLGYEEDFDEFGHLCAVLSPRVWKIFADNLAGRSLRSYGYHLSLLFCRLKLQLIQ
jgi:hypothetical protein